MLFISTWVAGRRRGAGGGVQPYGKEGRYDTKPIPNIRPGWRGPLQRVDPASNPLVPGPHCDIGRASRAQGAGSARLQGARWHRIAAAEGRRWGAPATLAASGTRATRATPASQAALATPRFAACVTSQPQEQPRHSHISSHTILATHTSPQQPKLACSCAPRAQSAGTYGDRDKEKYKESTTRG